MLCALTGRFARQTWLNFNMSMTFLDRGSNAYLWHQETPASRLSVAGDIDADLLAPNHQYSQYAKLVLVFICR